MYALLVDRIEVRGLTQFQVTAAIIAAGGKAELMDPDQQRERFDAWLREPLKPLTSEDAEQLELMRALGLGRW